MTIKSILIRYFYFINRERKVTFRFPHQNRKVDALKFRILPIRVCLSLETTLSINNVIIYVMYILLFIYFTTVRLSNRSCSEVRLLILVHLFTSVTLQQKRNNILYSKMSFLQSSLYTNKNFHLNVILSFSISSFLCEFDIVHKDLQLHASLNFKLNSEQPC